MPGIETHDLGDGFKAFVMRSALQLLDVYMGEGTEKQKASHHKALSVVRAYADTFLEGTMLVLMVPPESVGIFSTTIIPIPDEDNEILWGNVFDDTNSMQARGALFVLPFSSQPVIFRRDDPMAEMIYHSTVLPDRNRCTDDRLTSQERPITQQLN